MVGVYKDKNCKKCHLERELWRFKAKTSSVFAFHIVLNFYVPCFFPECSKATTSISTPWQEQKLQTKMETGNARIIQRKTLWCPATQFPCLATQASANLINVWKRPQRPDDISCTGFVLQVVKTYFPCLSKYQLRPLHTQLKRKP